MALNEHGKLPKQTSNKAAGNKCVTPAAGTAKAVLRAAHKAKMQWKAMQRATLAKAANRPERVEALLGKTTYQPKEN